MPHRITQVQELEMLYGSPSDAALVKEIDHLNDDYRKMLEMAPFAALATSGPRGLDCSPRGDRRGELVRIVHARQILMPDRRGNNRADSLRNILHNPRVALLLMIPGHNNCLRINGRAHLSTDPALLDSFAVDAQLPRCVIVIDVEAVYFQCARALMRSMFWDPKHFVNPACLPTTGEILSNLSNGKTGGDRYDQEWAGRAAQTLW